MKTSSLNIEVSCFVNVKSTEPKTVNLLTWLTSDKYKHQVEVIRQTESKESRAALKQRLPAITPSGKFTKRNQEGLIKHSGLLCIDIDLQDNKHIGNFSDLKKHLCNIQNFAFVGLSVSGNGYYCLVPISQPDKHKLHFKALQNDLERFGIIVDKSGNDVTRLRIYSYDSEAYINHQAEVYNKIYQEPKQQPPQNKSSQSVSEQSDMDPLNIVVNMVKGAKDGEKHFVLFRAARLAGGYIAGRQIDETTATNALEEAIRAKSNINSLEDAYKTIRDGIDIGKTAPIRTPEQRVEDVNNVENVKSVVVSNVQKLDKPIIEQRTYTIKPLHKATGRLAELEDIFIKDKSIDQRDRIISLLDYCKREKPTPVELDELEQLIVKVKTSGSQEANQRFNFTDSQRY